MKIHLSKVILVEGRYDKTTLENSVEATILPVHGFSVFTDKPLQNLIRKLAKDSGLIVLMDSDAAGFKIRGFINGLVPTDQITHVYIPDIAGKEKRKRMSSKEGTLGVEGMSREILHKAFEKAGVLGESPKDPKKQITKLHFIHWGLAGGLGSSEKRKTLYRYLGLPEKMSTNSALSILNSMLGLEELAEILEELQL